MLNIGLDLMEQVGDIAKQAGLEILKIYETDFQVEEKADSSPVTEADKASEQLIERSIQMGISDKYPIVGEEAFATGDAPAVGDTPFWLVDPHRLGAKLLKLAAKSIRHGLENAKPLPVDIDICDDDLTLPGACFITLKREGKLRGCIGTSEAHRALILDVADNAFRAAFNERTRAVLINSPNNPSGVLYSADLLEEMAQVIRQKERELDREIFLLSDEARVRGYLQFVLARRRTPEGAP